MTEPDLRNKLDVIDRFQSRYAIQHRENAWHVLDPSCVNEFAYASIADALEAIWTRHGEVAVTVIP